MNYDEALMATFIVILTAGYFISFLLCYFFGWYSDKRLRRIMRRVRIRRFERLFLHFRGGYMGKTDKFTAICVNFERIGILMLMMIPVSLLLTKLVKNILIFCRISLAVVIASVVSVIIAAIYSGRAVNKKAQKSSKSARRSKFRELDDISSGFEAVTSKNPAAESAADVGSVMESDKAQQIKDFKESFNQPRQSRSFYRPVVENSKLESFSDVRQRQSESAEENNLSATQSSEEIRNAISSFKQKNPIADENIVITRYSQVSEKYRNVKIKGKFADEDSLEQGREILRKRKEDLSGDVNSLSSSDSGSDLEILKSFKEKPQDNSEVGSLKDMIEQNKKG